jgi:HK97 family phage major capsid protein
MSFPALTEAKAKRQALAADLKSIFDEAGPDRDMSLVKSVPGDSDAVVAVIQEKNAALEGLAGEIKKLEAIDLASKAAEQYGDLAEGEDSPDAPRKRQSLGQAFIASGAYTNRAAKTTAHLDLDIRNELFERTDGWDPESLRTGHVDLSPEPRLSVLDFVPQIPTTQSAVKFMRETTFDDSAVAEKSEGGTYGEADLDLTEVSLPVEKIPVWLPITDEQLEDVPQAEAYVNSRLVYMARKRLNTQILQGDGSTPNLEGTENVSNIQTQALGADPIPDALYKLFVKIQDDTDGATSGGDADPSAVFIRPSAWQDVALLRTADGIYIWGHPSQTGPRTIWGVPVVTTNAVSSGSAVTGDYAAHSYLAVKRGIDVQVTNSHSTFFIEGKQAIRADMRVCMVHLRPSAFGELTGL